MPLSFGFNQDENLMKISVEGRFDFSLHSDFTKAYEEAGPETHSFIIDLGDTSYIDSSALGMLLLLRDYAGGAESNITIANSSDEVKKVFTVSNFHQLFTIK